MNDKEKKLWLILDTLFKTASKSKWWNSTKERSLIRGYKLLEVITQGKPYDVQKLDKMIVSLQKILTSYQKRNDTKKNVKK